MAAHCRLAFAYRESAVAYAMRTLDDGIRSAGDWARKAAAIDPRDAEVQAALGFAAFMSGRPDEAWECASLALASSPHLDSAISLKGAQLICNGHPAEGRDALLTALRLNPRDPGPILGRLNTIAISYYYAGDYAAAAEAAQRAIARYPITRYPNNEMPYRWLAAALGQLGRIAEAQAALHTAIETMPKAFDRIVRNRVPWHRREDYEHMLDGLRKAGWQG